MSDEARRIANRLRRLKRWLSQAHVKPTRWISRKLIAEMCRHDYAHQTRNWNERSIEYRFVFEQLTRVGPETVLDVGTGTTALPALMSTAGYLVTAIDNVHDFWPAGMFNRHFHVIDDDITHPRLDGRFDLITCVSVLEHIHDSDAAIDGMFRLLKPGGYLVLTMPYTEARYSANVYNLPDSDTRGVDVPYICQSYSREQLKSWIARNNAEIVCQEFWRLYTGEFWTCGEMSRPPEQVTSSDRHQHTCLLVRRTR